MVADAAAFERARRPKPSKLATNTDLRGVVAAKLDGDWSPQQIAQWLRQEFREDVAMRISDESIYRDLYMPSRKVFDASMFHRLRTDRPIRRPLGKRSSSRRERLTRASTRRCAVSHGVADITTQLERNASSLAFDRVVVKLNVQFLRR